jgi:hypothetical protein
MLEIRTITTTVENTQLGTMRFDHEVIRDYNAEYVVQTAAMALASSIRMEHVRRANVHRYPALRNIRYYTGTL